MDVEIVVGGFCGNVGAGLGNDFAIAFNRDNVNTFDALNSSAGVFGLAVEIFAGGARSHAATAVQNAWVSGSLIERAFGTSWAGSDDDVVNIIRVAEITRVDYELFTTNAVFHKAVRVVKLGTSFWSVVNVAICRSNGARN